MREGFGVMVYSKDQTYEGEWVRNKRQGWGRMSYSDGSYYEVIQHTIKNYQKNPQPQSKLVITPKLSKLNLSPKDIQTFLPLNKIGNTEKSSTYNANIHTYVFYTLYLKSLKT